MGASIPEDIVRAAWLKTPGEEPTLYSVGQGLEAALPLIEQRLREQLGRELDALLNRDVPRPRCQCPDTGQRSCGWRDGIGRAADLVRGADTG